MLAALSADKNSLSVQGFVLGQFAMLWALSHPDKIDKLVVLNTPVGRKSKLRPELAAYKQKMAMFRPDPKVSPLCRTSQTQLVGHKQTPTAHTLEYQ